MSNSKENNYVDFDSLQQMLVLNDMTLWRKMCRAQLHVVILKLFKRSIQRFIRKIRRHYKKGVNKVTFYDYVKLPILIADKLFSVLDINQDGF